MSETQAPLAELNPIEARILGCLIEKEATTPDVYPLTLNNILVACNQKTSRHPVMNLEQGAVHHALRQMEARGLVRLHHSARAERYEHRFALAYNLTPPQTALLALLMLRGAQTAHELFARSERLAKFESVEEVSHILERLIQRDTPLVALMPRRPAQRGERYRHLLVPGEAEEEFHEELAENNGSSGSLRERIEALEARVAALEALLHPSNPEATLEADREPADADAG